MSEIHIEEIKNSDNIKQFMEKCNDNFSSIARNGGGPRGADGETGATGATGKRGHEIQVFDVYDESIDQSMLEDFNDEKASYLIQNSDREFENDDFVFFTNGYIGHITNSINEDGTFVSNIDNLTNLKGPQGERGEKGDAASDQFDVDDETLSLIMKSPYTQLILPKGEELRNTPTNTLCIKEDIGFISNGSVQSSIKADNTEFKMSSQLPLTIGTLQPMKIGDAGSGRSSSLVTITGDEVKINSNGSANNISVEQSSIKISGDTKFQNNVDITGRLKVTGNISTTSSVSASTINTNSLSISNLSGINYVRVDNSSGFDVGGVMSVTPTRQIRLSSTINVTGMIMSSKEIKANNGDEQVYLGIPKYTLMPYPRAKDTPKHWESLNTAIVMSNVTEIATNNTNMSGETIRFKYTKSNTNTTKYYKIPNYLSNIGFLNIAQAASSNLNFDDSGSGTIIIINGSSTSGGGSSTSGGGSATPGGSSIWGGDDTDIFIDDDIQTGSNEPLAPVIPVQRNYAALLMKEILVGDTTAVQDMTGIFTIIENQITGTTSFLFPVPQRPSNVFKWIFKID